MRIKTKLHLSIMACVVAAAIIIPVIVVVSERNHDDYERSGQYHQLMLKVFAINALTDSYLLHPMERTREEWESAHGSLGALLGEIKPGAEKEMALVDSLVKSQQELAPLFSRLLEIQNNGQDTPWSTDLKERLTNRISVQLKEMMSDASRLMEGSQERIHTSGERVDRLTVFLVFLLVTVIGGILLLTSNRIVKAVLQLHEATALIADEKWDHKIDIRSDDEIGRLTRAFNEMTSRLSSSHTSLAQQREILQTIIDHIPVILCYQDPAGRLQLVNREFERLIGWSLDEAKERDLVAECCPDPEIQQEVREYMMQGAAEWRDFTLRMRTGEHQEISWSVVRLSDGSLIGIGIDVSEKRRAEKAIREQASQLDAFFTHSITPFVFLDKEFNFIRVNNAYAMASGRSPDDFTGRNHFDLYPHAENQRIFEDVVKTGQPYQAIAKPFVYPDHPEWGTTYWDWTLVPILDAAGEVDFLVFSLNDVTQRKKAEEEIKAAMKKLEQSNRALDSFASIASHDMQEPLRKIIAFGDQLKIRCGDGLGEVGCDYLERMQKAAKRMQALLKSLLDYSRVSSKAEPLRPVDLNELIREVTDDLEVRIAQTRGSIETDSLPTVKADPHQMRQLFQNLIGNALKFHRDGEKPRVRICGNTASEREFFEILVEDNGIGFDEKYLERIFAPFNRLHGRSTYEGTGMGLAICRKIVEHHGGTITAKSRPGAGSTFIVRLPGNHAAG